MRTSKYKLHRRALMTVLFDGAAGAAVVSGAFGGIWLIAEAEPTRGDVALYKNPQCGCCEGYADYLHRNGFKVKAVSTNDLTIMGQKYGIPDDMQPCHISLIGDYVVGGHIPMEVIDRLLTEKPKIVGITLPGMPVGTPGMPGDKSGPLDIYEIGSSPPKVYATI